MLAAASALLCTAAWPAFGQVTYGGSCTAACVRQVLPLPSENCYAQTGDLPAGGGDLTASEPSVQLGLDVYAATSLTSSATAGSGVTECSSSQEDVSAFAGLLVAASVRADAEANCSGVTGSTAIDGLVVAGQSITVTGEANQTVSLPGVGSLVINEQIVGTSGTELTVNALRLTLDTGAELVLCSAVVEVICSVPTADANWGALKSDYR
jgi:hypothetical protein